LGSVHPAQPTCRFCLNDRYLYRFQMAFVRKFLTNARFVVLVSFGQLFRSILCWGSWNASLPADSNQLPDESPQRGRRSGPRINSSLCCHDSGLGFAMQAYRVCGDFGQTASSGLSASVPSSLTKRIWRPVAGKRGSNIFFELADAVASALWRLTLITLAIDGPSSSGW
jgi:hypothetical protein